MKRHTLTLFILLTLIGCRQSESLSDNDKAGIIKDVRQTLDSYYGDIKKSGLTAEFKYLDNSTEFFWVPPGFSSSISYDSVTSILKHNAPTYKSIDNSFDTLQIIPLTKELVTYSGRISSTMIDTANKVMTFKLVETGVLIKRSNGWKLLHGQTSILSN